MLDTFLIFAGSWPWNQLVFGNFPGSWSACFWFLWLKHSLVCVWQFVWWCWDSFSWLNYSVQCLDFLLCLLARLHHAASPLHSHIPCSIPIAQSHTMQHAHCTVTHHAACPLHSHTPCSMPIAQSHTMQHAHRTVTHHAACLLARFALFCNDLTKMFNTILLDGCRYPANPAICKYAPRILSEPPRPSLPTTCCFLARDHTCKKTCPDHWFSPERLVVRSYPACVLFLFKKK